MRNHIQASITPAIRDVANERERQIIVEGFDEARDDGYVKGQLARAASALAYESPYACPDGAELVTRPWWWPWSDAWWKPKNQRAMLVQAAALLIAEIERIDRAAAKEKA